MKTKYVLAIVLVLTIFIAGCDASLNNNVNNDKRASTGTTLDDGSIIDDSRRSGSNSGSDNDINLGEGTLLLQITDDPIEGLENVFVVIEDVEVHRAGSDDDDEDDADDDDDDDDLNETELKDEDKSNKGKDRFEDDDLDDDLNETEDDDDEDDADDDEDNSGSEGGWFKIVDEEMTFDLLEIKDVKEFLGSSELSGGKYTQIRLKVKDASIVIDNETFELDIPSDKIKLIHNFEIVDGQTTTLTLDFDAEESIIVTGNEKYKLKPVIRVIVESQPIATTTTTTTTSTTSTTSSSTTTLPDTTTTTTTLESTTTTLATTTTTTESTTTT